MDSESKRVRNVAIRIVSERTEQENAMLGTMMDESLESGNVIDYLDMLEEERAAEPDGEITERERLETISAGQLEESGTTVCLRYDETELTGMEGSSVMIAFDTRTPGLVSMLRTGAVRTALTFEAGRRHLCAYDTPYAGFSIGVFTLRVDNCLLSEGKLILEYMIEVRGAVAERNLLTLTVQDRAEACDDAERDGVGGQEGAEDGDT